MTWDEVTLGVCTLFALALIWRIVGEGWDIFVRGRP